MQNVTLKDRVLWFDGTSQVDASSVPELLLLGAPPSKIVVNSVNEDISRFNMLSDVIISAAKNDVDVLDFSWDIPQEFLELDLYAHVIEKLADYSKAQSALDDYLKRIDVEFKQIIKYDMSNLFRTLVYVVYKFKNNNTIWGVGRGSSCASLVLFLIGIHKIDPVIFDIPMTEFFHE